MAAVSAFLNIHSPSHSRMCDRLAISGTQSRFLFRSHRKQLRNLATASRRIVPRISAADSDVAAGFGIASAEIENRWGDFSVKVSGEWDGYGADFTANGKPIHLPESVVPEAYREWDVEVFDWQTQCPTLAQSIANSPSLMYKTIKLLPTVGCEADAATRYSTLERNVTEGHDLPFAYHSNGSYVALWPSTVTKNLIELEHCLMNPGDKESRVRLIQAIDVQQSELKLLSITVFIEQWYGSFRNGDQLGGCAIRDSAFAASEPLKSSQVSDVWQALSCAATFNASHRMIQHLSEETVYQSKRNIGDLVLLPKQLWSSTTKAENGDICCEVGWLVDQGKAITSKCTFSGSAELKEVAIASEFAFQV